MNAMTQVDPPDPADAPIQTTPVSSPTDITDAVRETAMLVDVSLSMWGAERTDHKIMDDAKAAAGAVGNVGRAIKHLMSGADEKLRETRAAFAAVRATHASLTLPWVSDPHAERQRGPRLLPNALWDRYMTAMGQRKRAALQALDAFIDDYPRAALQAQANLAKLVKPSDYPTPDEVRATFRIALDFEPVPSGHGFRGLPEDTLRKLEDNLRKKQEVMLAGAMTAMWAEVHDRVARLQERLADPEARFKAPTVVAVSELTGLLPGWNVAQDPRAVEVLEDLDRMMSGVDAQVLRDDLTKRADVVRQAQAVTDKLAAWGL